MLPSARETRPWLVAEAEPHIKIVGLAKSFDGQSAVDGVDLDIYRGELFSLLGASGCGKTTLLRMLAGFVTPDQGSIAIDGIDMLRLAPYERPVNMMFQSYALFPHMSVEDNVAFGLRRDGVPRAEITQRVGAALELVQMAQFAKRKPEQLSGGQKQRVALARSIVKQPKVLLLDEPLSALDKKLREATQFELVTIQEQIGITFVMVTHDQEEAMSMSTRIAVMDRGRIVQLGPPRDIYEKPATRFVAGFIGSVNLFEGRAAKLRTNYITVECAEAGADLAVADNRAIAAGETLCVAVRPEKIRIAKHGAPLDTENRLHGRIKDMAYLGDTRIYQIELAGGKVLKVTEANHSVGEAEFARGETVQLGWAASAGVVLPP